MFGPIRTLVDKLKGSTAITATIGATVIATITAAGITLNTGKYNVADGVKWVAAYNGTEWMGFNGSLGATTDGYPITLNPGVDRGANEGVYLLEDGDGTDLMTVDSDGDGTLAGDMTCGDDLVVNGDSMTTDETTFNLLNTTATTVNAFGAATAINMGANGTAWTVGGGSAGNGLSMDTSGNVAIKGDISAAGGYRIKLPECGLTNVPAGGTLYGSNPGCTLHASYAGSIIALSVELNSTVVTGGTITCRPLITDGAEITGHDITFTSADAQYAVKTVTIAANEHTFAANAEVSWKCIGSADLTPDGAVDILSGGIMVEM